MTTEHEALKLADKLDRMFEQLDPIDDWRPVVDEAGNQLRAQHALIVQMADALAVALPDLSGTYLLEARNAIAAATQYLKGPKT